MTGKPNSFYTDAARSQLVAGFQRLICPGLPAQSRENPRAAQASGNARSTGDKNGNTQAALLSPTDPLRANRSLLRVLLAPDSVQAPAGSTKPLVP